MFIVADLVSLILALNLNKIHTSFTLIILRRYDFMCMIGLCNLLYVLWKLQTLVHVTVCESSIGSAYISNTPSMRGEFAF